MTIPQQNEQLPRRQRHPCVGGLGPPAEATLRKSFHAEPVALPVVEQEFEGGAGAVAEDVDGALQGVVAKTLSAHGTEAIDAFAEIDGFGGQKDPALGGELQHAWASRKLCTMGSR